MCRAVGLGDRVGLVVETTDGPIEAQRVVTCAGLHADEVAQAVSGPTAPAICA
jgi:L-2-hydroxyglutarate oxidase LhgO